MIIKNLKLKFFIYRNIFPIFSLINKICRHSDNKILLYCNLSFRDNNKAIYDYLIEHGYNEKYKIIVASSDYKKYIHTTPLNVSFVGPLRAVLSYFSCKYVFYCIGKLPIVPSKNQKVIHMEHGMPFKEASEGQQKYSKKNQHYTYVMATGKAFIDVQCRWYAVEREKIVIAGNPKCDSLFLPNPNYDFGKYKKLIIWTPTFRKSVSMNMQDTTEEQPILPIVDNSEFNKLNAFLKSIGVKIVVKLHPEQDLSKYNVVDMDHFILLSHNDFLQRGMDLYRFMKQCDAMITDYSSIFYDYLLLNRPIGYTEDDIEDYAGKRGFSMDPELYRPGFRIHTTDDICKFAQNLIDGNDNFIEKRAYVNSLVNEDMGGNFCAKIIKIMGIEK